MEYVNIQQVIDAAGLRLVMVQSMPSPWSHATKAMMEHKGLDYIVGPQIPGGENAELVAWAGTNSGPVVAWNDEAPINRWDDILLLLERLAPDKPLVPEAADQRAQLFGLGHEICGEQGLGWNRRLDMLRPAMAMDEPPEMMTNLADKWGFANDRDVNLANQRTVATLRLLADTLKAQRERGSDYFIGNSLTAVDFYWTAMSNLVNLMPPEVCPLAPAVRPGFEHVSAEVAEAVDPILIEHRDRIMQGHFVVPMEL